MKTLKFRWNEIEMRCNVEQNAQEKIVSHALIRADSYFDFLVLFYVKPK